MPRIGVLAAVASLAVLLAGCTATETPTPSPTASASLAPSGDGTLTIGTVFSATGADAASGAAQVAGAEVAVREINEAGGVLGAPVLVLHRDGGDGSSQTLEASVADLAARGVDAIVGPSETALAQRAVTASGAIPVIATGDIAGPATGLFTTLASGQARSTAVARALTDDGLSDIAIVASDDDAGVAAAESLSSVLSADGASLSAREVTAGTARVNSAAAQSIAAADPDAVIIATAPDGVPAMITALLDAGLTGDRLWTTVPADLASSLPAGVADGVRGIVDEPATDDAFAARVRSADPSVTDLGLAAQAYDAVVLAAIAAVASGDDGAASVSATVTSVSGDGVPCGSFAECAEVLTTRADIDYQGRSGPLDLDEAGRPTVGRFTVVEY